MKRWKRFLLSACSILFSLSLIACGRYSYFGAEDDASDDDGDIFTPKVTFKPDILNHSMKPLCIDLTEFSIAEGCGVFDGVSIVGTGSQGFLMFGPYLSLESGSYSVILTGMLIDGALDENSYFDIAGRSGDEILLTLPNLRQYIDDSGTLCLTTDFDLEKDADKIEFRLYVNEGAVLSIDSVTLSDTTLQA